MATKDFRASQLETSKIIGTGSITGTTAGIAIYSGSIASDRAGGVVAPHNTKMFENVGTDVFLFVSGTRSNNDFTRTDATLFGGDVVISGTLYAERQVIEVDSVADGDFFVTGNMYVEPDNNSTKSVAFRNAAGNDIFIVDASNKRIGVNVSDPDAQLEIFGTSTQLKLSNNADDFTTFAVGTNGDLTITTVDTAGTSANFVIDADGAVDIDADAGALSLDGSAGINIGTEADVAIDIDASTLDIDASGALTIDSNTSISIGSTADKPVVIESTTLDVNSSGAITIDGTSTFSIDGVGVSNITTNGALTLSGSTGLNIASDSGEIDITATKGNIDVNATVGTIDIDSAGALTIDSATSIAIGTNTDKPVSIDATTFTLDANSTVAIDGAGVSIDSTADSNITVTGTALAPKDLDIAVVGGSTQELRLASAGTGPSALHLNATAGGVNIDAIANITLDGDRLLISDPAPPGTDTLFSVSGSIGSKGTTVKGTAVFGGDLVVSGNLHGGSPLKINDDIALTGSARFKEQSAPTAGPNEAVLYAKDVSGVSKLFTRQSDGLEVGPLGSGGALDDAYDTPIGGGTKATGVGAVITADGQPVQIKVAGASNIGLAVTGSVIFGSGSTGLDSSGLPAMPGTDTHFFVSGSKGGRGSFGSSVFGGDLIVSGNTKLHGNMIIGGTGDGTDSIFFDGGGGNSGPWIRGNTQVLTIDGDNRVDIRFDEQVKFAGSAGTSEIVQIFDPTATSLIETQRDALHIFSGSIGSRGTTTRGTGIFGGDVVVSGTLRQAGSLHVYNQGMTLQNGDRFFSPFQGGAITPASSVDNVKMHTLIPYSGSLERVTLATRLGGVSTGVTVGLYVNGVLAGEMTGSTPSGATVVGGLTGTRIATFDFTGKSSTTVSGSVIFNANDFVAMQINGRASRDTSVTTVFRLNDTVDPDEIILP